MATNSDPKLINLWMSVGWLGACLSAMFATSLSDSQSAVHLPTMLLTFLWSLPAIAGLYAWRRYSVGLLNPEATSASTESLPLRTLPLEQRPLLESLPSVIQLTWLAQSLATLSIAIITLSTLRPIPLAGFIAAVLLGMEIVLFTFYSGKLAFVPIAPSALLKRANQPVDSSTTRLPISSNASPEEPQIHVRTEEDSAETHLGTEDPNYQDLLALRDQMERACETSADHLTPASPETPAASPRQSIQDFRDASGFGTISGETRVAISHLAPSAIITLAFVPPFPATPEVLADCEDERVDSVRVLQCQSLGAKIEIQLAPEINDAGDLTLLWEAMLEKQ